MADQPVEFAVRLPALSIPPCPEFINASRVVALAWLVAVCGCGSSGEIQEYVVKVDDPKIYTSELLKREFGTLPFQWTVPEEWTVAENDQFSKVAWQVEEGGKTARITLSELGIGPGIPAQVARWQGQVDAKGDPADTMESLPLKGSTSAVYIDMPGPEQSILGLMVQLEDTLWILKFRGENAVAAAERKRFREFCESISVE